MGIAPTKTAFLKFYNKRSSYDFALLCIVFENHQKSLILNFRAKNEILKYIFGAKIQMFLMH